MSDADSSEFSDDDMAQDAGPQNGNNLDLATQEFLEEIRSTRVLQMKPNANGDYMLTTIDFVEYLGILLEIEPELTWIAREMCNAPMPPNAEMLISKSNIVYFHDLENDYYTLEHPLTQRYLKVLERSRIDQLALRTKPAVNGLQNNQADILFFQQFRNLQIPCQDCGIVQATVRCLQCMQSMCQGCYDNNHKFAVGPKKDHTVEYTPVGSFCAGCAHYNPNCKPQVYIGNTQEYMCFRCFDKMYKNRPNSNHRAMLVPVSDSEIVTPGIKCDPPGMQCDRQAAFCSDFSGDYFCGQCLWYHHFNGHRREHTFSKVSLAPMCENCGVVRATVFDEQEQALFCTDCFTFLHCKGNRQLHLFLDGANVLLLMERLDPVVQEHLRRARPRVMWAITKLQGWTRGIEERRHYQRRRDLIMKVQRRWRGAMTRQKLLHMLDHYKWRRKQIHNYFLPKTSVERTQAKRKFQVAVAQKDVSAKATKSKLVQLKETVLETAGANPLEDPTRTAQDMNKSKAALDAEKPKKEKKGGGPVALPVFAPYDESRFGAGGESEAEAQQIADMQETFGAKSNVEKTMREDELTNKDIRNARDLTLRQLLRIDNRTSNDPMQKYQTGEGQDGQMDYNNTQTSMGTRR